MPSQPSGDLDSDEQLLRRTAAGDAPGFAALFDRCHAQVYRFALHMTGSPTVADDVTQDVFMVVMRDAARYEAGRSGVTAWLRGIARNCARQRLDRDRQFQPFDEDDEPSGEGAALMPDALGELTRAEGIERVRRAVLRLPVRYREVVVLCDLQELSYSEAADALGCVVGTVRSRLHRARALLAAKLSADHAAANVCRTPRFSCRDGPTAGRGRLPARLADAPAAAPAAAPLAGTAKWRGRTSCA